MKIGDKVLINEDKFINVQGEIERISLNDKWPYLVKYGNGCSAWFSESELTPYIYPLTNPYQCTP